MAKLKKGFLADVTVVAWAIITDSQLYTNSLLLTKSRYHLPSISENTRFASWARRVALCFVLMVSAGIYFPCLADIRSEEELKSLKTKIDNLQVQLQSGRNKEQTLVSSLENLERKLAELIAERYSQKQNLATLKSRKKKLDKKLSALEQADNDTHLKLRWVLRSSYILHRQDSLRLMLNQEHPENIARTLSMYRYVVNAKKKEIEAIRQHQAEVLGVSKMLESQQSRIDQTLIRLDENKIALSKAGEARQLKLNLVQDKLSTDQRQVENYQQRQAELNLLLTNLQRQKTQNNQRASKPTTSQANSSTQPLQNRLRVQPKVQLVAGGFIKSKGRLAMPIMADIKNRFGQIKPASGLLWEGLMFDVDAGQNVVAIYPGQVVFSDWFRGYGQLLILDHGDGYMSLYGHNQLLHVALGTVVDAGQIVAFAGSSGGLSTPGLYFEIRHDGVPDNPLVWCYGSL